MCSGSASFSLLYSLEHLENPLITIKIIGHQWYWTYEFSQLFKEYNFDLKKVKTTLFRNISFDSYMVPDDDLFNTALRLLDVDRVLLLPLAVVIRFVFSGADVIHSWAVPAFGIKTDCIPGRLNQTPLYITRKVQVYGQCSELCGINHGFMPISVVVLL